MTASAAFVSSCNDNSEEISDLNSRVSALEKQDFASLKSSLENLSGTVGALNLSELQSSVSSLQNSIGKLVSTETFNAFKDTYISEKSAIEASLEDITSKLGNLDTFSSELESIKSSVEEINNTLTAADLSALALTVEGLKNSIKSVVFVPGYSDGQVVLEDAAKPFEMTYEILPAKAAKALADDFAAGKGSVKFLLKDVKTRAEGAELKVNKVSSPADGQIVVKATLYNVEAGATVAASLKISEAAGNEIQSAYTTIVAKTAGAVAETPEGTLEYAGVTYKTVVMKDGKTWMAENLRFLPEGITPSSDVNDVTAGVYYPVALNEGHTAAEFTTSEDVIKTNGYLYQTETALGLKVGDLTTIKQAEALEGAQGICPDGWHVPTGADIVGLVGKCVGLDTKEDAPYYDAAQGKALISLLNEDGFNADAWGAFSVQDNSKTSGTVMGYLKTYADAIASGYLCGSTYAGVAYNTKDDETSGIKNFQFYSFMPMASLGTFNGAKLSYRIAAPLRCVKDAE